MGDLLLKAANELGFGEHVSVKEFRDALDPADYSRQSACPMWSRHMAVKRATLPCDRKAGPTVFNRWFADFRSMWT